MQTLRLSSAVLEWAAHQAGATLGDVASRISKKSAEKIADGNLTPAQAMKFAELVDVPFGYLFASAPPSERELPIADFRSVQDAEPLGKEFLAVYDDAVFKQDWYREYRVALGAGQFPFVGRFYGQRRSPAAIANDIRKTLGLTDAVLRSARTPDEVYGIIADKAEESGIIVLKNGVVGNNTSKPLPVSQFRGFALSDPMAPLIFVNGSDAKAAWQFTLAHELAHIWIGDTGVSHAHPGSTHQGEMLCNAAAAELLVPNAQFLSQWEAMQPEDENVVIGLLKNHFRVSALVIARRALDNGLISQEQYKAIYLAARKAKGESGGDFYRTLSTRNGKRFSKLVASLAVSGEVGLRQAARLLNTTPGNVMNFYERQRQVPV